MLLPDRSTASSTTTSFSSAIFCCVESFRSVRFPDWGHLVLNKDTVTYSIICKRTNGHSRIYNTQIVNVSILKLIKNTQIRKLNVVKINKRMKEIIIKGGVRELIYNWYVINIICLTHLNLYLFTAEHVYLHKMIKINVSIYSTNKVITGNVFFLILKLP